MSDRKSISLLLETENKQLQKLNDIVIRSIEEEKLISKKLYEFEESNLPFNSKVADRVTAFGGSWKFIFLFLAIMTIWIMANIFFLLYDPYPFILLNLLLSTVAALQAPFIMMSQNRKEEKDRQRSINDYLINLKAEIEVRNLHQKLDLLITEQMQTMFEIQKQQMDLMEEIKAALIATE